MTNSVKLMLLLIHKLSLLVCEHCSSTQTDLKMDEVELWVGEDGQRAKVKKKKLSSVVQLYDK